MTDPIVWSWDYSTHLLAGVMGLTLGLLISLAIYLVLTVPGVRRSEWREWGAVNRWTAVGLSISPLLLALILSSGTLFHRFIRLSVDPHSLQLNYPIHGLTVTLSRSQIQGAGCTYLGKGRYELTIRDDRSRVYRSLSFGWTQLSECQSAVGVLLP